MKLKRRMRSITSRWFLSVFSFILVFLIIVGVGLVWAIKSNYMEPVSGYLERRADVALKSFSGIISQNYYDIYTAAAPFMADVSANDEALRTELFDSAGALLRCSDGYSDGETINLPGAMTKRIYSDPYSGQKLMSITVPLRDTSGRMHGALRYTVCLDKVYDRQVFLITVSVISIVFVALLVFLSGFFFMQSIVRPVNSVTATASLIAKGDFSIRVKGKHREDEIGDLSDAINNMASELSKIDKLKNDFISSVSHELRTPLTAIRGWNETIQSCDPVEDREMIGKGLQIISTETDRLSKMVEELLDYSKMQSGRFTLFRSRVNLFDLFLETFDIYAPKAAASDVDIVYDTPLFSPFVNGDPNRIKQVFINIIDNAVKHSSAGGVINVAFISHDGMYTVFFTDHGSGIKASELPHVKERFYKGSSMKPGSGLGLAVCDEIMQLHGGSLDIDSQEGKGTTIALTFPADSEQNKDNQTKNGDNTENE